MEILYVPNGGFGDVSWSTSWPRIFSEKGHEVDIFLMLYTGNPFYANPYVRKMFSAHYSKAANEIMSVINNHSYDMILIPETTCGGVREVIEVTKDVKNVRVFKQSGNSQILSELEIPPLTKPEWYFKGKELDFIKNSIKDYDPVLFHPVLFHPVSSSTYEKTRNIDFDLIVECAKEFKKVFITHGGRTYLPIEDLKRMEVAGVSLLWEDYNCFNDEYGHPLGKILALTSCCPVSVHGWSGSMCMSMGFNKPYVVVVPENKIRANKVALYQDARESFNKSVFRARYYGCLNPSAWCITDKVDIIIEAINYVLLGKTVIFDRTWTFI